MPAHILLERAEARDARGGEPFAVRWSLVNAGDQEALVTGWCVWCAAADPATLRADDPPPALRGSVFSQGRLRLQPGQRLERIDGGGGLAWPERVPPGPAACFVASVEYTDDTRAARRVHAVQVLGRGQAPAQHCHFASLST